MTTIEKAVKDYVCFLKKETLSKFRTRYTHIIFSGGTVIRVKSHTRNSTKMSFNIVKAREERACECSSLNNSEYLPKNPFEDEDFLNAYSETLNKNLTFKSPTFHEVLTQNILNFKKSIKEYPEFSGELTKAYCNFLCQDLLFVSRELCVLHPLDLTYQTVYGTFKDNNVLTLSHIPKGLERVKSVYVKDQKDAEDASIEDLSLNAVSYAHQEQCTSQYFNDYVFPRVVAIIGFDGEIK